ncbi:MAG: hypothetical protein ACHRXM_11495 [Isosphaerales bacterium]
MPPNLTSLTFGITKTGPGQYQAQDPIAIGASSVMQATTPYGSNGNGTIVVASWSGGTDYGSYLSVPATNAPPGSESVQPSNPAAQTYGFIVDSNLRQYTETVVVDYAAEGVGTSTLTFTSVAPTGRLAVQQVGTQSFTTGGGSVTVQLSPPIQIKFTASTGPNTGGQFMIMQIIDSIYRQYLDSTNQSWYLTNGPAFPALNGPLKDNSATWPSIGYPLAYGGVGILYAALRLGPNDAIPASGLAAPYLQDTPSQSVAISYNTVSARDSFSDYLMFKSNIQGSVWIALSQIDWNWHATAINVAGTWGGPNSPQPNPTGPTIPTGAAVFPSWVNTGQAFVATPFQMGS